MPQSAHTALVVSIVASALGGLIMCLLVARYGLTPSRRQDTERGLLVTRFGHALAGVCFAATGILSLVALFAPSRESRPVPQTIVKVEPDRAAETRLQTVTSDIKAMATRLEQAEARVSAVDSAARHLADEVGSMGARAKEIERTTAARADELERTLGARTKELERTIAALPRRGTAAETPVKETKPVATPSRTPERLTPPALDPASPTPLPQTSEPAVAPRAQTPDHATASRTRTPEPTVHRTAPTAARTPEAATSPRSAPSPGRATSDAPARGSGEGGSAMAKPDEGQLGDKLRDDWKTIRGGLATAGDDFKAAVRDLGRKLWP